MMIKRMPTPPADAKKAALWGKEMPRDWVAIVEITLEGDGHIVFLRVENYDNPRAVRKFRPDAVHAWPVRRQDAAALLAIYHDKVISQVIPDADNKIYAADFGAVDYYCCDTHENPQEPPIFEFDPTKHCVSVSLRTRLCPCGCGRVEDREWEVGPPRTPIGFFTAPFWQVIIY